MISSRRTAIKDRYSAHIVVGKTPSSAFKFQNHERKRRKSMAFSNWEFGVRGRQYNVQAQDVQLQFDTSPIWTTTASNTTATTDFPAYRWDNSGNNMWTVDFNTTTTATTTGSFRLGHQWTEGLSTLSDKGKLKHALMQIFEKVDKKLIKTKEDKKMVKAKEKSEKLLKEWLSPNEIKALEEKGEMEVPSTDDDDVIFIVKKDPNAMVEVKKNGKHSHRLCLIAEDLDYPVGDQLLSKVAMLKTDEKQFKEIAIKHS